MNRIKVILLFVLCIATFSGCATSMNVGELITPPKLTKEQTELYTALETAVGDNSFTLKYPLRGEYRSAFVLHDLNGNGLEEAVAFYEQTVSGVSSTWIAILAQGDGQWYPAVQIPAMSSEIDFIDFSTILHPEEENIIVGYAGIQGDSSVLGVYGYAENNLPILYSDSYNELLTMDFDGNGREELVLFNLGIDRAAAMRLVGYTDGNIEKLSDVMLPNATKSVYAVGAGQFAEGLFGVYADIMLNSDSVTTIIATVEKDILLEVFPQELGFSDSFDRNTPTPSVCDIDGDGYLEIPQDIVLPGYAEDDRDGLYLTRYYSIEDGQFKVTTNALYNHKMAYKVNIPSSWADVVTVVPQPALNEWSICVYNGSFTESTTELLRIRVAGPGDYIDQFDETPYEVVATRGNTQYMVYIPPNIPRDLAVTLEEIKAGFGLI